MRKKFKSKKMVKCKKLYLILLVLIIYYIFNNIFVNIELSNSNYKILNNLLLNINNSNSYKVFYKKINKYIFNDPLFLLETELNYKYKKLDKKVELVINNNKNNTPKIYIYNSHQGEQYNYKYLENHNIIPDVLMASQILKDKLENININTIVEKSDILAYIKKNNLNHAGSYIASRYFLTEILKKYNNLELYIDLHRDAVKHFVTYTNINGKDCAKVLFVIGLENPNYEKNLEVVTKINNIILKKYPSLTRGIMKKQGYGVNGVYNQDLNSNVILLEVGGNENNIDEVNNTLSLIAEVIGEYINEKNEKK